MTKIVSPLVNYYLSHNMAKDYTAVLGSRSKTIVFQLPDNTNNKRFYFSPDPEIDQARIESIQVVINTELGSQPQISSSTGDFLPNLTNDQASNIALCLAKGDNILAKLSLRQMVRVNNGGKFCFFHSEKHIWQDCFFELENNSGISANQCIMIIVYFTPLRGEES